MKPKSTKPSKNKRRSTRVPSWKKKANRTKKKNPKSQQRTIDDDVSNGDEIKKKLMSLSGSHTGDDVFQDTFSDCDCRLETDTLNYMLEMNKCIDNGFENDETKEVFFSNLLKSIKGCEINVACNSKTSKILEKLLTQMTEESLIHFMEIVWDSVIQLCFHPRGSYVMQTILNSFYQHLHVTSDEDDQHQYTREFILMFTDVLCNDIKQFMNNKNASHVMCSLLELLSGMKLPHTIQRRQNTQYNFSSGNSSNVRKEMLKEFSCCVINVTERIIERNLMKLQSLIGNVFFSCVIQALLIALRNSNNIQCQNALEKVLRSLTQKESAEWSIVEFSKMSSTSFLIEIIIQVSPPHIFEAIVNEHFLGHLNGLICHFCGNFVVQRLLSCCTNKPLFNAVYMELEKCWSDIFNSRYFGVLTALCDCCARLNSHQDMFMSGLSKLLNCSEQSDEFVQLVVHMETSDSNWKSTNGNKRCAVNYHWSILLQTILTFKKPSRVVEGILKTPSSELMNLFCNPFGSHILDAFFKSTTVRKAQQNELITHLKGCFVDLACNKNGSTALESVFTFATTDSKVFIMDELAGNFKALNNNQFGFIVGKKLHVDTFMQNRKLWMTNYLRKEKKQRLFKDLLLYGTSK